MRASIPGRAMARACAAIGALSLATSAFVMETPVAEAAAAPPQYMAAAEYFGDANPYTLWSSTLNGAPAAFAQMKSDGFNTVGLVLPWGEFQPGLTPVRYDPTAFRRLDQLITDANKLGMGVILRLSYALDVDPSDQLPWLARFTKLWSDPKVYSAWLGYIAKVHQEVDRFSNIREAYISWEDLWEPVSDAQTTTTASQRLQLAAALGYRSWLESTSKLSLSEVGADYATHFTSWSQVPTPLADQPSFRLMLQYEDWALVHRLFVPAAARFPGLTMETRVDVDPIYSGPTIVGSFGHTLQYQLPGTSVTGMYFSPYMGDPSTTPVETATQAISALQSTLSKMATSAGHRRLFIYEYEITSNSPEVSGDPELTTGQLPTFIASSEPLLAQDTAGYALWVYRDYNLSPVYNPSFALGGSGWKLSGGASAAPSARSSYVRLRAGSAVSQHVFPTAVTKTEAGTFAVEATASTPTLLSVTWGTTTQRLQVQSGTHTYDLPVPAATSSDLLTLRASGDVELTNVQLSWFTQTGSVYSTSDQPEAAAAPLRALNHQLAGPTS